MRVSLGSLDRDFLNLRLVDPIDPNFNLLEQNLIQSTAETFDIIRGSTQYGAHGMMYRDERWKLITYHVDDGTEDIGELYDLCSDPWEHDDLWQDAACREIKSRLVRKSFDASMLVMDPGPPKTLRF